MENGHEDGQDEDEEDDELENEEFGDQGKEALIA